MDRCTQRSYCNDEAFEGNSSRIVAIDGMVQSPDDLHRRYGWAPIGEELRARQLFLGGSKHAVHAAMTEQGFIGWHVFVANEDFTDEHVALFWGHDYENMPLYPFAILDNASNQRSERARTTLGTLFENVYEFLPPYAPELNPIECGLH